MSAELVRPYPDDCERMRQDLIARDLPAVWSLEAAVARQLHREGVEATQAAWTPPLASMPETVEDQPAVDGRVAMRRYGPADAGSREADRHDVTLAWFHGGGWVLGDLETGHAAAMTACAATGWEVVSVDYRCAPVDRFPAAVDDAIAATRWLLGLGSRVVVGGDSAGGNLAGAVAFACGDEPGLVGQVLVYPAADPSMARPSIREFTTGPWLTDHDMEWFYEQYLPDPAARTDPGVDLLGAAAESATAPVDALVFTVGHDPLRDEGIELAEALRRRGSRVHSIHAPELFHGALTSSGLLPSGQVRVDEIWVAARQMFT